MLCVQVWAERSLLCVCVCVCVCVCICVCVCVCASMRAIELSQGTPQYQATLPGLRHIESNKELIIQQLCRAGSLGQLLSHLR